MDGPGQIQPKRQLDKILLVGESGVGKRSLVLAYLNPDKKDPEWTSDVRTEDHPFHVAGTDVEVTIDAVKSTNCFGYGDGSTIWDQWLCYPNTSVVLICVDAGYYAPKNPGGVIVGVWWSVETVRERWAREMFYFFGSGNVRRWSQDGWKRSAAESIRTECLKNTKGRRVPFLIVGCKIDLKKSGNGRGLTFEEGKQLASDVGAEGYFECSATTGQGVKEVFEEAARLALLFADSETITKKNRSLWGRLKGLFY